jgi:hypothetical protein
MRRTTSIAAIAALITATLGAREARGFCRSTTCDTPEMFAQCDGVPEGCEPLSWRRTCIGWNLHEAASKKVPYDVAELVLEESFLAWRDAFCGPGIQIQNLGSVRCNQVEYSSLAGNANVIMFRDDAWPHEGAEHNIALTTVTFDVNTGEIFDADIEVNSFQFNLTWDDSMVDYDFQSVMTHEIGHFLGLSHSSDADATMYRNYDSGTVAFRTLEMDDNDGICSAYPPFDTIPPACNPIPRHGFSPDCAALQKEGSCSVAGAAAPGRREPPAGLAVGIAAAGVMLALGRRRAR